MTLILADEDHKLSQLSLNPCVAVLAELMILSELGLPLTRLV